MILEEYVHILNPNASHRLAVEQFFKKKASLKGLWVSRESHPTHLETIVQWALIEGHKKLVVWGGDGTINRVVQALHKEDLLDEVSLAFVPVGTGNDFLRRFQYGSWKKWIQAFEEEKVEERTYDIGLLKMNQSSHIFVNNAGFGRAKDALSQKRPNPIQDILSFREKQIELEWGTDKMHHFETMRCLLGIVFNSPYFNRGMYFNKDVRPDDGLLYAVFIPNQSKVKLFLRFLKSKLGLSLKRRSDACFDADFLNLNASDVLFPQVDGEVVPGEGSSSLKFSVLYRSLRLLVPVSVN